MTLISGAQILRHFLYHHVTKIRYFKTLNGACGACSITNFDA